MHEVNGKMMETVRAVVRPIVTISGWGTLIYLIVMGKEINQEFFIAVMGLTAWWFATRQSEEKKP